MSAKHLLLAAGLVAAIQPALAGTANLGALSVPSTTTIADSTLASLSGSTFTDDFIFSLADPASGAAVASTYDLVFSPTANTFTSQQLGNFAIALYQGTSSTGTLVGSTWQTSNVASNLPSNLTFADLAANTTYDLQITGSVAAQSTAAGFAGALSVAAIPEPGTSSLMLSGLLAVTAVARRRRA